MRRIETAKTRVAVLMEKFERKAMRHSGLRTQRSGLSLQLHLLDADRLRQIQREASLPDRLIDAHVGGFVARDVAVTFGIFELRRQVALLVDPDPKMAHAFGDALRLGLQIEKIRGLIGLVA